MAYVVMASAGMAYSHGLHGLYRYFLYSRGLCYALYSYGPYRYGLYRYGLFVVVAVVYIVMAYIVMVYSYGPFCG